ncbi:hypothetical protein V6Z11_A01G011200 [Gossypium hirsutum]|uniref:Probable peroxisomal membrane protein PEX13 n=1 Tax=Gossypium hirsutum TaxID=3635 RepID=A0A1U8M5C7_GOSHI|nr:probable peroxisomal membrane protein PEX13 [Gossypium hirsutum]
MGIMKPSFSLILCYFLWTLFLLFNFIPHGGLVSARNIRILEGQEYVPRSNSYQAHGFSYGYSPSSGGGYGYSPHGSNSYGYSPSGSNSYGYSPSGGSGYGNSPSGGSGYGNSP